MLPPEPSFDPALAEGIGALLAGEPRRAVRALRPLLDEHPFHPVVHFDLAAAYRLLGELPFALAHARVAAEILESAPAYALHGVHLHLARRRDEARAAFRQALKRDPAYRNALLYLALLDREEGRRDEAIAGLEASLADGPAPLPRLVAERARGQLFDLSRGMNVAAVDVSLCGVCVVTEVMLEAGVLRSIEPALSRHGPSPRPSPARAIDPEGVAAALHRASRVVALTGAGISSASGLATRKELWLRHDRDACVSAIGRTHDPQALWSAVRDFLSGPPAVPNAAHDAVARLPGLVAILTQNVDDLHQRAALPGRTVPVVELHGTLERMVCGLCGAVEARPARAFVRDYYAPPCCVRCNIPLRPDVVLFGEQVDLRRLEAAVRAVEDCDVLLVIGCAMDVAPASELPRLAAAAGARVVEVRPGPTRISDAIGSDVLYGKAEETLPAVLSRLAELEPMEAAPERPPAPPAEQGPPMRAFVLPNIGEAVTGAELARLLRGPGDRIERGQPIAEFDTDKASLEVEAPFSGVVRAVGAGPGDRVAVGTPYVWVEPDDPADGSEPPRERAPIPLPPRTEEPDHQPIFAPLGPRSNTVRQAILALRHANWLKPGEEHDFQRFADAHAAALGIPPLRVWWSEGPAAACERWNDWLDPGTHRFRGFDPATSAWRDAWGRAEAPIADQLRSKDHSRRMQLVGSLRWRRAGELFTRDQYTYDLAALMGAVDDITSRWLARIVAGLDPPCPFEPLLQLFMRGVWPFVLPDGVLGVWVPRVFPFDADLRHATHRELRDAFPGLTRLPRGGLRRM